MAEVITLAKMPAGNGNKFIMTDEQKQYYLDNYTTMTQAEIGKYMGVYGSTISVLAKEYNLPKKYKVYKKEKPETKFTEFFSWENATIMDWAFGIQGQVRF